MVVKRFGLNIQYIEDQTEELQMAAIEVNKKVLNI